MAVDTNIYNHLIRVPYDKEMDAIFYQLRNKTPMADRLNATAGTLKTKEVRWTERFPLPKFYLINDLSSTGTTGTTALTFTTGSAALKTGDPIYEMQKGDILRIGTENMRVESAVVPTAASGTTNGYNSVTVERGVQGTTAAVHAAYAETKWAGSAADVNWAHPGAINDPGKPYVQYVQRLWAADDIDTFDEAATDVPYGGGLKRDQFVRPKELAHKLETAILYGGKSAPSEGDPWGTYDGIYAGTTAIAGSLYTTGGITQTQFENILVEMQDRGVDLDLILTGSVMTRALNSWYHGQIVPTQETQRNLMRVKRWLPLLTANESKVEVMPHPGIASGEIYFLDMKRIQLKYLYRTYKRPMGDDGSGPRHLYEMANVLKIRGSTKQGKITNLTAFA